MVLACLLRLVLPLCVMSVADSFTPRSSGPPSFVAGSRRGAAGVSGFSTTSLTTAAAVDADNEEWSATDDSGEWSVADDWNNLSGESSHNKIPNSNDIFNQDLAQKAARAMEESHQQQPQEQSLPENGWLKDTLDTILSNNSDDNANDDDKSLGTSTLHSSSDHLEDDMGLQIAMLVRCNQSPTEFLVAQGRALPALSDAERNDVSQLVTRTEDHAQWTMTEFFRAAVATVFDQHAATVVSTNDNDDDSIVLDAVGLASWMQQSLGPDETGSIGRHDRRITTTISKYCSTFGSGYLTKDDFLRLYRSAIVGDVKEEADSWRQLQYRGYELASVWRDLRNHGIQSPVETMRAELLELMEDKLMTATSVSGQEHSSITFAGMDILMDECEILEEGVVEDLLGRSRKPKSSYQMVELVSDNQTPVWVKDGEFVFIDEDSCIGCTQCVSAAPSSFKMMEDGRARTFSQRSSPDVDTAVEACPVDCMHHVSFHELREFEVARDNGDGRTDHRHMGQSRTPLNVAGIDSDANHRSSWYHFLKNKCFMSKQCPQKGCYDCPYASEPGGNPYFNEHLKKAVHIRAEHFEKNGMADTIRKTAEL